MNANYEDEHIYLSKPVAKKLKRVRQDLLPHFQLLELIITQDGSYRLAIHCNA